jgi:hypothetical protein
MLVAISAEHSFDVESHLIDVKAPTMVRGGAADHFYSEDLFRLTAARDPGRTGSDVPRQGPHLGGQLQDVDVHRPWLPDRRSSVTTVDTRLRLALGIGHVISAVQDSPHESRTQTLEMLRLPCWALPELREHPGL